MNRNKVNFFFGVDDELNAQNTPTNTLGADMMGLMDQPFFILFMIFVSLQTQ